MEQRGEMRHKSEKKNKRLTIAVFMPPSKKKQLMSAFIHSPKGKTPRLPIHHDGRPRAKSRDLFPCIYEMGLSLEKKKVSGVRFIHIPLCALTGWLSS